MWHTIATMRAPWESDDDTSEPNVEPRDEAPARTVVSPPPVSEPDVYVTPIPPAESEPLIEPTAPLDESPLAGDSFERHPIPIDARRAPPMEEVAGSAPKQKKQKKQKSARGRSQRSAVIDPFTSDDDETKPRSTAPPEYEVAPAPELKRSKFKRLKGSRSEAALSSENIETETANSPDDSELFARLEDRRHSSQRDKTKRWWQRRKSQLPAGAHGSAIAPHLRHSPIRKAKITVLDGIWAYVVHIKQNTVVNVEKTRYDSLKDSVAAAVKRRGDVVWACPGARSIKTELRIGSQRVVQFQDAAFAETSYKTNVMVARNGHLLFVVTDPLINRLRKKCTVYLSAGAVLPYEDGYWLRVGISTSEMTLVVKGAVTEWAEWPGLGTATARERMNEGGDPPTVLREQVRQLSQNVTQVFNEWMGRGDSAETIRLHGPGRSWTGVERALRDATGCLILEPQIIDIIADERFDDTQTATAVLAQRSNPMFYTSQVLRRERVRSLARAFLPYALILTGLVAVMGWSWKQGEDVTTRIQLAEERSAQAWTLTDTAGKALSEEAQGAEELLTALQAHDPYAWENVVAHKHAEAVGVVDPTQTIGVQVFRCEHVDVVAMVSDRYAGIEQAEIDMQAWAVDLFGEGATATDQADGSSFSFDTEGRSQVAYQLSPASEMCGVSE